MLLCVLFWFHMALLVYLLVSLLLCCCAAPWIVVVDEKFCTNNTDVINTVGAQFHENLSEEIFLGLEPILLYIHSTKCGCRIVKSLFLLIFTNISRQTFTWRLKKSLFGFVQMSSMFCQYKAPLRRRLDWFISDDFFQGILKSPLHT